MIVRGNITNYTSIKTFSGHDIFKNISSCNSKGEIRTERYINPEYKYAKLNHYYTKSIYEYCAKVKRGRASQINTDINVLKSYYFKHFFEFNNKTTEKINIFNKEFNKTFK